MIKILLKKELLQFVSGLFARKNKKTSGISAALYAVILLLLVFSLGMMFYTVADTLAEPLFLLGFDWLYFALLGMMSIFVGVLLCAFTTYSGLFHAKDNELLLSMPIPTGSILIARMLSIFLMALVYSGVVFIPAVIRYAMTDTASASGIICSIILYLLNALLILALSCFAGWLVALIASRVRNKSAFTVISYLVFLAVYYIVYFRMNSILSSVIQNLEEVGEKVSTAVWPAYQFGRGCTGNVTAMLLFAVFAVGIFAVAAFAMNRSFVKIATTNKGTAKKVYVERAAKAAGPGAALMRKELGRFLSSPAYMLNCGMGLLFMIAAAVFLLIKHNDAYEVIYGVFAVGDSFTDFFGVISAALVMMMAGMSYLTAPSVSLEGKNIWIVQTAPVSARYALQAKEKLQMIMDIPPVMLLSLAVALALKLSPLMTLLIVLVNVIFVVFNASLGLMLNLRFPRLDWTNEAQPIKQSLPVMITMFGSWLIAIAVGGLFFPAAGSIRGEIYLLLVSIVLAGVTVLMNRWIYNRGAEIFAKL